MSSVIRLGLLGQIAPLTIDQPVAPSVPAPPVPAPTVAPEALFTPETVAPPPPILLRLLQEPTMAHARAFLAWHQARLARFQEVQALLHTLSTSDTSGPPKLSPGHTP